MQKLLLILTAWLCAGSLFGQSLKKYPIGNTGCSAYFFCDPGTFDVKKSPDLSDVYTGECKTDETFYGIICVKLSEPINDMQDAEDVLGHYMDFLKGQLNIVSAMGYGKGHRLKDREDTRGMIDYWKDKDDNNWKVKGWTNGSFIAVMYVYNATEVPESKANVFLNSLLFKGM